jgi:siroheme synthase-like protein
VNLSGKTIIVIGAGTRACRSIQSFLDSNATIWVISKDFSVEIMRLGEEKKVALLKTEIKDAKKFVDSLNPKPAVLLAVTSDRELNLELVRVAKGCGSLVYVVADPAVSDFSLP